MSALRVAAAFVVLLTLQFVPRVGMGDASAATQEQAYNSCVSYINTSLAPTHPSQRYSCARYGTDGGTSGYYQACEWQNQSIQNGYESTGALCIQGFNTFNWGQGCPAGTTWDTVQNKCFDPSQCLAKENLGGGFITTMTDNVCVEGCEFKMSGGGIGFTVGGATRQTVSGWAPTGNACQSGAPAPQNKDDPQACVPAGTLTMCLKQDGEHCATASTGKQLCWRPGETGEKASGDVMQTRGAGNSPIAPATPPPPGGSFTQQGSATAQTSAGGLVFNTTITNYGTGGVEASTGTGAVDQGEPSDGTGAPADGDGDGKQDGSVSGGVDCENPPVVTGDPILANIVLQTWGTRCAAEAQNAVHSSGNIQDCSDNFTVTGPEGDPNVDKLRGIRAEICGHYGDDDGNGQPDWTQGNAPSVPGEGDPEVGDPPGPPSALNVGTGLLDMGGMLGGSTTCPELGTIEFGELGSFDMNSVPMWCDLVSVMRAVVLLMAAFAAIRILMGGK